MVIIVAFVAPVSLSTSVTFNFTKRYVAFLTAFVTIVIYVLGLSELTCNSQ